jgi:hypothetical protein
MRQKHPGIMRALTADSSVVERFWTKVDRRDDDDSCWAWRGLVRRGGYPTFCVRQFAITATHIAWFTRTGEIPPVGRIIQLCGNSSCVRPSHLAWTVGRAAERSLETWSDGYVKLSGSPQTSPEQSKTTARVFRIRPSSTGTPAPEAA